MEANFGNNHLLKTFIGIVLQGIYLVKISYHVWSLRYWECALEYLHLPKGIQHDHIDISSCSHYFQPLFTITLANLVVNC